MCGWELKEKEAGPPKQRKYSASQSNSGPAIILAAGLAPENHSSLPPYGSWRSKSREIKERYFFKHHSV